MSKISVFTPLASDNILSRLEQMADLVVEAVPVEEEHSLIGLVDLLEYVGLHPVVDPAGGLRNGRR